MEIERKFLINQLPDLSGIVPLRYERYYLYVGNGIEERIQKTNERYTYEKKTTVGALARSTELKELSVEEFRRLKGGASRAILRDSYAVSPNMSIKIYHGEYEGLIRVEVEFSSVEDAADYTPEVWMGAEITNTSLGRDSSLLKLKPTSVRELIEQYS